MPAPVVEFPVQETSAGRRIFKNEAEAQINLAFDALWELVSRIPAGPQGERGAVGPQGERWIQGVREFAEGLQCVTGNGIYRRYPGQAVTALFRCLQPTTTNSLNFPSTAVSNAAWEVVMIVPWGERGPQGVIGNQGPRGEPGFSSEIVEFDTDAAALAYSAANPLALVISTEGF